jgi:hypothetical protein
MIPSGFFILYFFGVLSGICRGEIRSKNRSFRALGRKLDTLAMVMIYEYWKNLLEGGSA